MLNKKAIISLMLFTFLGIIATANGLGYWELTSEVGVSGDSLLIEVAETYQIPLEEIYSYWKIPSTISPRAAISEAKDAAGFSTGQFKAWAASKTAIADLQQSEEVVTSVLSLEIKGSATLQQISDNYNIPLDLIYSRWQINKMISPHTPLKELKDGYGFALEDFKSWVAANRK